MQNRNKFEIKSLSTKLLTEEWHTVGKMNRTAITNRLQYRKGHTVINHRDSGHV